MTATKNCVKINTTHSSLQSLLALCTGDLGQVSTLAQDCLNPRLFCGYGATGQRKAPLLGAPDKQFNELRHVCVSKTETSSECVKRYSHSSSGLWRHFHLTCSAKVGQASAKCLLSH